MTRQERRDRDEKQSLVSRILEDSIQHVDNTLSPAREEAAKYYRGEPFGNEEPGRSQLVLTEVRDGVLGQLPSLMRVSFGAEQIVEFRPNHAGQVAAARQATQAIQHIFAEANPGFLTTYGVLKDGLIKRIGIYKYWKEDREPEVKTATVEGLDEATLGLLTNDPEVTVVDFAAGADGTISATIERRLPQDPKFVVDTVPPEEFLWDKDARSLEDATFVGHRRNVSTAYLRSLGIPDAVIDDNGGTDSRLRDNDEAAGRREAMDDLEGGAEREQGEENEEHLYVEGYFKLADENGVYGLQKICTIGPQHFIVMEEPATHRPFATFCPDPEPHTMGGQSLADRLKDMQKYKSSLIRASSDSLALSIFPRLGFVENMVNVEDVLNTEIGAPIRMKGPNAIQEINHTFVGKEALTLLAYADDVIERRTGRNKGTAGLDASSLQSSTREGVKEVLNSAQEQQELIARIFAEGTLKPLFRGLLQLVVEAQPKSLMTKVAGAWTPVDPTQWDANMGVTVSAMLGTNFLDGRVNDLLMIAAKQEAILTQLGPANPLVSLPQYRHTIAQILQMKGRHDVDAYFKPMPPDWEPPPPPPPQPDPTQVLAMAQLEVEKMKTEREFTIKEAELALKREELASTNAARMREIELQHELDMEAKRLEAEVKISIARMQDETKMEIAELQARVKTHETLQDGVLREEEIEAGKAQKAAKDA